jgi:hypothetical protein
MSDGRPHLDIDDLPNRRLLEYMANRPPNGFPRISARDETWKDPYWQHGSRPEIVEWVWDKLGSGLLVDCRFFLYGTPALVTPQSGVVLAVAWGTSYLIRVPPLASAKAIQLSAEIVRALTPKGAINPSEAFGEEWVYGLCREEEIEWCRGVYAEKEGQSSFEEGRGSRGHFS